MMCVQATSMLGHEDTAGAKRSATYYGKGDHNEARHEVVGVDFITRQKKSLVAKGNELSNHQPEILVFLKFKNTPASVL